MFDVTRFIDRKNWTIEELAKKLFEKGGTSRVGMWKTGDSNPRYDAIIKLIHLGATAEELFGKECADRLLQNSVGLPPQLPPEIANAPDFLAGQNQALKDIEAKIAARVKSEVLSDLKSKGVI